MRDASVTPLAGNIAGCEGDGAISVFSVTSTRLSLARTQGEGQTILDFIANTEWAVARTRVEDNKQVLVKARRPKDPRPCPYGAAVRGHECEDSGTTAGSPSHYGTVWYIPLRNGSGFCGPELRVGG